jgi:hypothetical protein
VSEGAKFLDFQGVCVHGLNHNVNLDIAAAGT